MAAQWYYEQGGEPIGPISGAELKQLAADGQLSPTDQVWKEGLADWTEASQVKGLFSPLTPLRPQCPRVIAAPADTATGSSIPTDVKAEIPKCPEEIASESDNLLPTKSLNNGLILGLVVAGIAHFWALSTFGVFVFGINRLLLLGAIVAAGYFGLLHRWWHYGRKLFAQLHATSAKGDGTPAKPEALQPSKSVAPASTAPSEHQEGSPPTEPQIPEFLQTLTASESTTPVQQAAISPAKQRESGKKISHQTESVLPVFDEVSAPNSPPKSSGGRRKIGWMVAAGVLVIVSSGGAWKFGIGKRPPNSVSETEQSDDSSFSELDDQARALAQKAAIAEVSRAMAEYDGKNIAQGEAVKRTDSNLPSDSAAVPKSRESEPRKATTRERSTAKKPAVDSVAQKPTSVSNAESDNRPSSELDGTLASKRDELLQLQDELNRMLQE